MSPPTSEQLLELALGVLPAMPCAVDALSETGGSCALRLDHQDEQSLVAYAPADAVGGGVRLLVRVFDESRGRYEVEFEVVEGFFHTGHETLVHMAVCGVRHLKARRAAARMGVSIQLDARVRFCRTMPKDTAFEVRLVDVSATGLALVTQRSLDAGDLLHLQFPLEGRPVEAEARVVRVDPAPYGRYRAGCEITEISDEHRRLVSTLATAAEAGGSERERRPDHIAALSEARQARAARTDAAGTNHANG
jgi:hypothetical protein